MVAHQTSPPLKPAIVHIQPIKDDTDDKYKVEPWMLNPFNPSHKIFWLIRMSITPGNDIIRRLYEVVQCITIFYSSLRI